MALILEEDWCSAVDGPEGQHNCHESSAGCNRKPVEVMEDGSHVGEFGKIVNKVLSGFLFSSMTVN